MPHLQPGISIAADLTARLGCESLNDFRMQFSPPIITLDIVRSKILYLFVYLFLKLLSFGLAKIIKVMSTESL